MKTKIYLSILLLLTSWPWVAFLLKENLDEIHKTLSRIYPFKKKDPLYSLFDLYALRQIKRISEVAVGGFPEFNKLIRSLLQEEGMGCTAGQQNEERKAVSMDQEN